MSKIGDRESSRIIRIRVPATTLPKVPVKMRCIHPGPFTSSKIFRSPSILLKSARPRCLLSGPTCSTSPCANLRFLADIQLFAAGAEKTSDHEQLRELADSRHDSTTSKRQSPPYQCLFPRWLFCRGRRCPSSRPPPVVVSASLAIHVPLLRKSFVPDGNSLFGRLQISVS